MVLGLELLDRVRLVFRLWPVGERERRDGVAQPGQGVNRKRPHLGDAGQGVNRQRPHLGDRAKNRQRPHLGGRGKAIGVRGCMSTWIVCRSARPCSRVLW